jgi:hypothetical protein
LSRHSAESSPYDVYDEMNSTLSAVTFVIVMLMFIASTHDGGTSGLARQR